MGCSKSLTIGPAITGDLPMDDAAHDSTDDLIIGVRGGRVYKCSPTTGAVLAQSDYQQLGLGGACIVWDSGINRCFASAWNTGNWDFTSFGSIRNFYRIIPASLAVDLVSPFGSTFGVDAFAITDIPACGLSVMKNVSGTIYALGWSAKDQQAYVFQFLANAVGTNAKRITGGYGYPSIAYAKVGGTNDTAFWASAGNGQVVSWDFTASSGNTSPVVGARGYVAIEYAPAPVDRLYVTREFQFIDIYDTGLNYISTVDTGRTTFQAVNILRNPNDGLLYICGGSDNTVIVLNPVGNSFTVKTGFDLPWKTVFTPTKKFAVQQGSVGLKEIT